MRCNNNRILNMEIHFLIGALLVCSAVGLPVKGKVLPGNITPMGHALLEDQVAYVYDDNMNLIKLTLDDEFNDEKDAAVEDNVLFFLYKKDNPTDAKQLYVDDENALKISNFDPTIPTRFVTHGWMNSGNSLACTLIRDAYLLSNDYNVIVIDWGAISNTPDYIWASNQVKSVAQVVAKMINFIVNHGMDPSQINLVGHSLGAHVVGMAALFADSNMNYVVGLDPAWPNFMLAGEGSRISKGDAEYVEIIHTDAGLLGFPNSIGDVDFYPNGGNNQPGCGVDLGGSCSHSRSYMYFAESINSSFLAKSCDNYDRFKLGLCNIMQTAAMGGDEPQLDARGNFYLKTNPSAPYAIQ